MRFILLKRKVTLTKVLIGSIIGFYIWASFLLIPSHLSSESLSPQQLQRALASRVTPIVNMQAQPSQPPISIAIPSIALQAPILPTGNTADGSTMDVPYNFTSVFWYKYSSAPGADGGVILAGHVDGFYSKPAIFWNLDKIQVGDQIHIQARGGTQYTYQVISREIISKDDAQKWMQIMNAHSTKAKMLTLITCSGEWIPAEKTRTDRVVIQALLK